MFRYSVTESRRSGETLGAVPGVPDGHVDPELVLLVFLPPILFPSAMAYAREDVRPAVRPVAFLALGLVLATTVAVLLRSVPLALAVGIAWAGPFEHLLQNAWTTAGRVFPGLLLEAFVAGGTPEVSPTRALVLVAAYAAVAAAAGVAVFARRDVST